MHIHDVLVQDAHCKIFRLQAFAVAVGAFFAILEVTKAKASFAGAPMRVEAEMFRIESRIHVPTTFRAARLFTSREAFFAIAIHIEDSVTVAVAAFKRFDEASTIFFLDDHGIDHSEQLLFTRGHFRQREFYELFAEISLAVTLLRQNLGQLNFVLDFERSKNRHHLVEVSVKSKLHQVARCI